MKNHLRIIPFLEIKNNLLVKGINFEGLRALGKPEVFSNLYKDYGADEILLYDVTASLYGLEPNYSVINKVANRVNIPVTYTGGINSLDKIKKILRAGANKVSLNSYNFENINFVDKAINYFGSSTIAVNLQVRKFKRKFYCLYNSGRDMTKYELNKLIKIFSLKNVGEIIITDIASEGTAKGLNRELINYIRISKNIPIILHGGYNGEIIKSKKNFLLSGIALSSLLHYNYINLVDDPEISQKNVGNFDYINNLNKKVSFNKDIGIQSIKKKLSKYFEIRRI